jgi:hypothetical protein
MNIKLPESFGRLKIIGYLNLFGNIIVGGNLDLYCNSLKSLQKSFRIYYNYGRLFNFS